MSCVGYLPAQNRSTTAIHSNNVALLPIHLKNVAQELLAHCLLHDCDIVYSEIIVSSRHLNLGGAPAFMFCFTKGGKIDITLSYLHTMLITNLFDSSVSC